MTSAFATNYTVTPAEGWPGAQLESPIVLTFDDAVEVVKTDGTYVTYNMPAQTTTTTNVNKGMELTADGNKLNLTLTRNSGIVKVGTTKPFASMASVAGGPAVKEGGMQFRIEAGAFTVGGVDNEEIILNYYISNEKPAVDMSYTNDVPEGWQITFQTINLTFGSEVAVVEAATSVDYTTASGLNTGNTGGISTTAEGNVLTIKFTRKAVKQGTSGIFKTTSPALVAGDFIITIPAGSYTVAGEAGPEIVLNYYVSNNEPTYNYEATFTPSNAEAIEELGAMKAAFDGKTAAWNENAEVTLKYNGVAVETSLSLSVENGALVVTPATAFTEGGTYTLSIPTEAYNVDGKKNQPLEYTWTVTEKVLPADFDFSVTPAQNKWQSEVQYFELTFDGEVAVVPGSSKQVAYNFEGNKYLTNMFANEYFKAEGDKLLFAAAGPRTTGWEPFAGYGQFAGGEFTLTIQEKSFTVNGVPNKAITLKYYVSESKPLFFSEFDADPEQGEVESLDTINLDFFEAYENVEIVNDAVVGSITRNGEPVDATVTIAPVFDDELTMEVTIDPAQTLPGEYKVMLPADFFTVEGLLNDAYVFSYSIAEPPAPYTVSPEEGQIDADNAPENVEVTFLPNDEVKWVAPVLTVDGVEKNVAVTLFAEGNKLTIDYENLFTTPGEYKLVVPAACYTKNGEQFEELVFEWTVVEAVAVDQVVEEETVTVYDLQGRQVLNNADRKELRSLRGFYIVNGRKMVIR